MLKRVIVAISLLVSSNSYASLSDCNDLYVHEIIVDYVSGLKYVRFKESPFGSGSALMTFSSWSAEQKKQALTVLTSAKAAGWKFDISKTGACNSTSDVLGLTLKN